ncbi:MAG: hypothetical protein ACYCOU_18300 [Sulfobacillus sp.]
MSFVGFLQQQNVLHVATAFVIGTQINNLSTDFIDTIFVPILNRLTKFSYVRSADEYNLRIFGIDFKVGLLIIDVSKFLMTVTFIYVFLRLFGAIS